MSSDIPQQLSESDEKQLCGNCMTPNELPANFCIKCGAPISSYAATGPFESLFAEGYIFRQAAERPRKLIAVLGMWLIFGPMALTGSLLIFASRDMGLGVETFAAFFMTVISVVLLWKTSRNYFARNQIDKKSAA